MHRPLHWPFLISREMAPNMKNRKKEKKNRNKAEKNKKKTGVFEFQDSVN